MLPLTEHNRDELNVWRMEILPFKLDEELLDSPNVLNPPYGLEHCWAEIKFTSLTKQLDPSYFPKYLRWLQAV